VCNGDIAYITKQQKSQRWYYFGSTTGQTNVVLAFVFVVLYNYLTINSRVDIRLLTHVVELKTSNTSITGMPLKMFGDFSVLVLKNS